MATTPGVPLTGLTGTADLRNGTVLVPDADADGEAIAYDQSGARLAALDPSGCRLLIDTPVVRLRDFRAVKGLQAWRSVSVAEDCARLPWIPAIHALEQDLGPLQAVAFEHAAYAYHGVATGRALGGGGELDRAQRQRANGGSLRTLQDAMKSHTQG